MLDKITTHSTSLDSAKTNDIILRETKTTRLVFKPLLVNNSANPIASVKGSFIFQRKGVNDAWQDINEALLTNLKSGEGYKLELHSVELREFYKEIGTRYELYSKTAIPQGDNVFLKISQQLDAVADITTGELNNLFDTGSTSGVKLLVHLLNWANSLKDQKSVLTLLEHIDAISLQNLAVISGISTLRKALETWNTHKKDNREEFWQRGFNNEVQHLEKQEGA